jgi:hypothetical protein
VRNCEIDQQGSHPVDHLQHSVVGLDRRAGKHQAGADDAVDGRAERGITQLQTGQIQAGLIGFTVACAAASAASACACLSNAWSFARAASGCLRRALKSAGSRCSSTSRVVALAARMGTGAVSFPADWLAAFEADVCW